MTLELILSLLAIVICLILSFLFSGSETAMTGVSRARILQLEKAGNKRAKLVHKLIEQKDSLIGAILIGNNLVNTAASSIATGVLIAWFGDVGLIYATFVMTVLLVLFSEISPKTLALYRPEKIALAFAPFVLIVIWIFRVPSSMARSIARGVLQIFGVTPDDKDNLISPQEELRGAVDLLHREGSVKKDDRDMLGGLLDLGDLQVSDVMIHRTKMEALDASELSETLVKAVLASPYTRLPLFEGKPENIIGVLHAKDMLRALQAANGDANKIEIRDLITPPWFIPETTTLVQQLKAFRKRKAHFALVVDEYGEVMGLITLEDILEEIVGDIADEFDVTISGVRPQGDGSVHVDGALPIRDLNRAMDWELSDENATTIAGLVIHEAGIIPDIGQAFIFFGFRFEILRKSHNRILSIKINKIDPI